MALECMRGIGVFMPRRLRILTANLAMFSLLSLPLAAQESQQPTTAGNPPPQIPNNGKLTKEQKQKIKKTLKELDSPYRTWLNEDVVYIISPDERNEFLKLSTNEEREQFIEQFWLRRSSNPDLPDNDFKEEHYRRIAYANEHFASGIPGWKTDRGRIYIIWGTPDEIESHPTGGTYDRPMEEGGGSTTTYPWETWRYRYLEGIGENIIIEFVDPSGSGEYHDDGPIGKRRPALRSRCRLDAHGIHGHGEQDPTFPEHRWNSHGAGMGGGQPASLNEFTRLELYDKVQRPPEVKYKDLEAIVTSRMVRDQVKFSYRTDFLKVTSDTVLVPVTVQIPNSQLMFKTKEGVHSASLNIFGRVSTLTGRVVQTFEDSVTRTFRFAVRAIFEIVLDLPEGAPAASRSLPFGYRDQGRGEWQRRRCE